MRSGLVERTTFLRRHGDGDLTHLFFVITNEFDDGTGNGNRILIVNATTDYKTRSTDPACPLKAGDHPFIVRDSYIAYRYAEVLTLTDFFSKQMRYYGLADENVFQRICNGFMVSRQVPRKAVTFYTAYAASKGWPPVG